MKDYIVGPNEVFIDSSKCVVGGDMVVPVDDLDFVPLDEETPPLGELVAVHAKNDGAPDAVLAYYTDRQVSPGVWEDSARVYEWASLEDYL